MKTDVCYEYDLDKAVRLIEQVGIKATDKRTKLLCMLLEEEYPLSAYEIMDKFNEQFNERVVANSIYRILDCLTEYKLTHRLSSINKYIACNANTFNSTNCFSVFVICGNCQKTHESPASSSLLAELNLSVEKAKFSKGFSQIELQGLCQNCRFN